MSYLELYKTAIDADMIQRLTVAVADVADDVFVESGATPNHDLRLAMVTYAGPELSRYRNFASQMALALFALNQGFDADTTDAELKTAIETLWTPYAQLLEARGVIVVTP